LKCWYAAYGIDSTLIPINQVVQIRDMMSGIKTLENRLTIRGGETRRRENSLQTIIGNWRPTAKASSAPPVMDRQL